jgi:glucose-1-phosphate cytidylyltransferase
MMTYGDGVSDVDLAKVLAHHDGQGTLATVTAVHPIGRFGHMDLDGDLVASFNEKPQMREGWINGGFFVLEPGVFDYIPSDVDWAKGPMGQLAADRELTAYRHEGFWQCMDTLRDRQYLEQLWASGAPPWKTWDGSGEG